MTREEAIEILKGLRPQPQRGDGKSTTHLIVTEALNMAIKALEQELCEDAVSRAKAMEICKSRGHDNSAHCISELPSVTPKTKWIPVNERLPEDRENVLFSTKAGIVFEGRFFDDKTNLQWYEYRYKQFEPNSDVTAWMPLPKAYKEEKENE